MTRGLLIGIAAVLAASVTGTFVRAQQQPVFRSSVDVVSVNVSVVNARTPVGGLGVADFVLTDNGVRQEFDVAPLDTLPIDVTLILGTAPTSELKDLAHSGTSAEQMSALLRPTDRLRVVSPGERVEAVDMRPADKPLRLGELEQIRGNSLNDSLFYALAWPVEADRRHLVVVFTDGFDGWSTIEAARLPLLAGHSDAVLHAVLFGSIPPPASATNAPGWDADATLRGTSFSSNGGTRTEHWMDSHRAVDESVKRTGGALHRLQTSVDAFRDILADFRSSYVLRFTPKGVPRGGWHDLSVKVTRPGSFTIRARRGYEGAVEK